MGEAAARVGMTPEEYLAFERASAQRHEYADGEVFAMSGGTYDHSLIGQNVTRELGIALLDGPCDVHGSDMRIKVVASARYFYADALVVCGQAVFEDDKHDTILNPKLIVEVLSDSTERYDRGEKFTHYRKLDALLDYVLVSQAERIVEHFHRQPNGAWLYRALGPGERLVLEALACEIAVDRIYWKAFRTS